MTEDKTTDINIRQKLACIQTEIKAPKNQHNSFGNYDYRSAEDIQKALKPYEEKYDVATIISDSIEEIGGRVYVKARVTMYDIKTGESISTTAYAREAETKKGMDDAQVTGATSSYARKYALNGLLLLDDTRDVDTDEYQAQKKEAEKKAAVATSKPKTEKKATVATSGNADQAANERRQKYQDLIDYCKTHGDNLKEIVAECELTPSSTAKEFEAALDYAIAKYITGGGQAS